MQTKTKFKLIYFLPALIWSFGIFYLSSFPAASTSDFYWQDFIIKKTAHILEYGVLTVLVYWSLINNSVKKADALVLSVIFSVFYGVTDELHQSFTPGREPRVRDIIFDTIGAIAASIILWKLLPKAPKKLKNLAASLRLA